MLIVFDLDGTLVDSRRDLADAANALLTERGAPALPVDRIASMVGEGAALLVRRVLAAARLDPEDGHALSRFLHLYEERLLVHTRLYEGIHDVLKKLATSHTLAVLTNKPQRPSREILAGLGVGGYFAEVAGGDGPYPRKPDPAGLLGIMRECDYESGNTVMVGDSKIDVATARSAGTHLCVARYGFGFHPEEISVGSGELAVDHPSELPHLLSEFRSPNHLI